MVFMMGATIFLCATCFFGGLVVLVFFNVAIGAIVSLGGSPFFGAIALLFIRLALSRFRREVREALSQ
jgi:hypothetical protein